LFDRREVDGIGNHLQRSGPQRATALRLVRILQPIVSICTPFSRKERVMVLVPLLLLGIGVALWCRRMDLMSRLCAACLCVLLASLGWGQERTKETFRDVADRMVKAINAADYEGIRKDFNKE